MEIRRYLAILGRYWWVILLATLAGGIGSAAIAMVRQPTYAVQVRVAVSPDPTITDTRSLIDLAGQSGFRYVAGTYAEEFTSAAVKQQAEQAAGLTPEQADSYKVDASVLPDSSVIVVSATGPNAGLLANYVNATVKAAIDDTRSLYKVMQMQPLETAVAPTAPDSPRPLRDIALGAALGFALGIFLALLLDYLLGSSRREDESNEVTMPYDMPPASRVAQE